MEACDEAMEWFIKKYPSGEAEVSEAWNECPKKEWLVWWGCRLISQNSAVEFAEVCAGRAEKDAATALVPTAAARIYANAAAEVPAAHANLCAVYAVHAAAGYAVHPLAYEAEREWQVAWLKTELGRQEDLLAK